MIDWFEKNNVECALSVDGDEETFNMNRKMKNSENPWNKINQIIDLLMSRNIKLSARVTYNSLTFNKLYYNIKYLVDRGFKNLKVVPDYFDEDWSEKKSTRIKKTITINR